MEGKSFEHPETNQPSPGDIHEAPITPFEADKLLDDLENGKINLNEHETSDFNDAYYAADEKLNKLDELNEQNHQLSDAQSVQPEQTDNSSKPKVEMTQVTENKEPTTFDNLDSMKDTLEKSYKEIKEDKPANSPNIAKWFAEGGTITIEQKDGKTIWTYTDASGRSVEYIDGEVKFPPEAKHPTIPDINIGEFTGDREKDKKLYIEKLEEEYGLTEIPEGYALHHDTENGVMQLIKIDYHKEFTHVGGHSMYKEE